MDDCFLFMSLSKDSCQQSLFPLKGRDVKRNVKQHKGAGEDH